MRALQAEAGKKEETLQVEIAQMRYQLDRKGGQLKKAEVQAATLEETGEELRELAKKRDGELDSARKELARLRERLDDEVANHENGQAVHEAARRVFS